MGELVEKCKVIINEQIIEWADKEGMTDKLLEGIIRHELIPIISEEIFKELEKLNKYKVFGFEDGTLLIYKEDWADYWRGVK